ncbi:MAG: FliH/SctL family protein [Comamonadaceae bacterium]|nr:FliH/SctL family protein [Comamonadaceae bacterium]
MSYLLALHPTFPGALATTQPVVPASELPALTNALALADELTTLLATQQQQLDEARAQAEAEGMQAGLAAGQAQARQEAADTLAHTLEALAQEQAAQREELRGALVTLATSMVRCMAAELAPPDVLAALAERAFENVVPAQSVRLRLAPAMLEPVQTRLAGRTLPIPVQCQADDNLAPMECVVESPTGTLIAGLDAVLDRVAQSLELSRQMAQQDEPAPAAATPALASVPPAGGLHATQP